MAVLALALALAPALVLAGCGRGVQQQGSPPAAQQQPAAPATCILGATGADVQVQITGDSTPCDQQIQALAGGGLSWYEVSTLATPGAAGTADGETMFQVCQLSSNGSVMTVMDAGGASYGQSICSSNEQGGWEPS
jgi:hypothetical protein